MKKLLFIFSLYLFSFTLFAQSYSAFPDSNAVWSILIGSVNQAPPYDFIGLTYHHANIGDTLIGTHSYNKFYVSVDSSFTYDSASYKYAIREDTNKRVYCVYENDSVEKLLYDFSINLGDSVWIHPPVFGYTWQDSCLAVVDSVDSVLIGGNYRRQLHFFAHIDKWVEGIGSLYGLIYPASFFPDGGNFLLCFSENDTVKYIDNNLGTCYYKNTGINEISDNAYFTIYPNPTTGEFRVSGFEFGVEDIQVYDLFGRLLLRSNKPQIDMSSYPAGLYIWRVGNARGKLVIE